jgi:peptidoglycan/LPS O-acetylase OafA/YrhL
MKKVLKQRLKDLALYVAICTVIIGMVSAMFYAGMSLDFFTKWISFALVTALLFGLFIQHSRALIREKAFWFLFTFALLAHCALWTAVFAHVKHWKFVWFYPMLIETAMLQFARNRLKNKLRREKPELSS